MTTESTTSKSSIEERIVQLEKMFAYLDLKLSSIELALRQTLGIAPIAVIPSDMQIRKAKRPGAKLMSDEQKAALIDGIPYDKKTLEGYKRCQLAVIGGSLGTNTFGLTTEKLISEILKAQPKTKSDEKKK
jgi:hypothetical protein